MCYKPIYKNEHKLKLHCVFYRCPSVVVNGARTCFNNIYIIIIKKHLYSAFRSRGP